VHRLGSALINIWELVERRKEEETGIDKQLTMKTLSTNAHNTMYINYIYMYTCIYIYI